MDFPRKQPHRCQIYFQLVYFQMVCFQLACFQLVYFQRSYIQAAQVRLRRFGYPTAPVRFCLCGQRPYRPPKTLISSHPPACRVPLRIAGWHWSFDFDVVFISGGLVFAIPAKVSGLDSSEYLENVGSLSFPASSSDFSRGPNLKPFKLKGSS